MTGARPHWHRDLLAPTLALSRKRGREQAPAWPPHMPRSMAAGGRIRTPLSIDPDKESR